MSNQKWIRAAVMSFVISALAYGCTQYGGKSSIPARPQGLAATTQPSARPTTMGR